MTTYCGVDPDTKTTGICLLRDGRPEFHLARASGKRVEDRMVAMAYSLRSYLPRLVFDFLAVEWQHYRPGREKNPNSMFGVQAVAGMALALGAQCARASYFPVPSAWRGTIEKEVEQRRILTEAGLTLDSPEFAHVPRSMRTHCVDALGLCQWLRRGRVLRGEAARA